MLRVPGLFCEDVIPPRGFMSAVVDLVALTLLPVGRWRAVAEQLQAGWTAPAILEQQCDRWSAQVGCRSPCPGAPALRSRAMAALERASGHAVDCLPLGDPRYPSALRSISDPPPVLWIRGSLSVFDASSVAIVGSRSGSPYALAVAERLSAVWRAASIPQRTVARSQSAVTPWPCWAAALTWSIPANTRR